MAGQFGSGDTIDYGDIAALDGKDEITCIADVYFDNITTDHAIISKELSGQRNFIFFFDDVGISSAPDVMSLFIEFAASNERAQSASSTIVANKWYRVLGRWKRNTTGGVYIKILDYATGVITKYTNAAPVTTSDLPMRSVTGKIQVGETDTGIRDMAGKIANVFTHNKTYSEEIEDRLMRTDNYPKIIGERPVFWDKIEMLDTSTSPNWGTDVNGSITGVTKANNPPTELFTRIERASFLDIIAGGPIIRNIAASLSLGGGIVSRKLIARRTILQEVGGYEPEGFEEEGYETGTGGISLTGSVTSKIVISKSLADSLSPLTGAVSRVLNAVRSISDSLPMTDNVVANLTGITRSIADTLSPLTGSVSRKLLANRIIANSLTPLTGSVAAMTVIVKNISDSLTPLTGSVAVLQTFGRNITDSISPFTGTVSGILSAKRSVSGNITFTDVVTGITAQIANLIDSISPFSGSVSVQAILRRTINDSISLLSSVIATINHFVSIVDSLTLTGVVTALTIFSRNLSDSIGLTGVVNRILHAIRGISNSISLSSILSALIISTTSTRKMIGSFKSNSTIKKSLKSFLDIKNGLKS